MGTAGPGVDMDFLTELVVFKVRKRSVCISKGDDLVWTVVSTQKVLIVSE